MILEPSEVCSIQICYLLDLSCHQSIINI